LPYVSTSPGKVLMRLTRTKDIGLSAGSVTRAVVAIFKNPSKVEDWTEINLDYLEILQFIGPNTIKEVRDPKRPVNANLGRGYFPDVERRRILVLTSTETEWKIELQYLKVHHSEIQAIFNDIMSAQTNEFEHYAIVKRQVSNQATVEKITNEMLLAKKDGVTDYQLYLKENHPQDAENEVNPEMGRNNVIYHQIWASLSIASNYTSRYTRLINEDDKIRFEVDDSVCDTAVENTLKAAAESDFLVDAPARSAKTQVAAAGSAAGSAALPPTETQVAAPATTTTTSVVGGGGGVGHRLPQFNVIQMIDIKLP